MSVVLVPCAPALFRLHENEIIKLRVPLRYLKTVAVIHNSTLCSIRIPFMFLKRDSLILYRNKLSLFFVFLENKQRCIVFIKVSLRYYATFKVRKFESLFYKINTILRKTTNYIGLQANQIFSVNV